MSPSAHHKAGQSCLREGASPSEQHAADRCRSLDPCADRAAAVARRMRLQEDAATLRHVSRTLDAICRRYPLLHPLDAARTALKAAADRLER